MSQINPATPIVTRPAALQRHTVNAGAKSAPDARLNTARKLNEVLPGDQPHKALAIPPPRGIEELNSPLAD